MKHVQKCETDLIRCSGGAGSPEHRLPWSDSRVNSLSHVWHGHGSQGGGAILITHVLKCVTDLIRCSGGAGSPEHRLPWSDSGVNSLSHVWHGHGSQGGGAILMTHVQKCETDLIRCSGGAGSPEHRLPWSDSGVNSLSHVWHGHGSQGGGAILMTHVQKCETDLIRCSGGAGSPEHRLPWSDSGVNSLSHVWHGHGSQGGGAILITHVQKCKTDLIRCSGGAGSPEHRLPWSDSGVNSLSHVWHGHGSQGGGAILMTHVQKCETDLIRWCGGAGSPENCRQSLSYEWHSHGPQGCHKLGITFLAFNVWMATLY